MSHACIFQSGNQLGVISRHFEQAACRKGVESKEERLMSCSYSQVE